jgi:hypothetical protein
MLKDEPGLIGIASHFLGRYREFDISLSNTAKPAGTVIEWQTGMSVAANFNNCIRMMLEDEKLRWIWFLGDDHEWKPNLLTALLYRNVDVVVPLCVRRAFPFRPVILTSKEKGYESLGFDWLNSKRGLIEATNDLSLGNAGMLVKREVLEEIEAPWYEYGTINPEVGASDLCFFEKLRESGARMYLDTDNVLGHITHVALYPNRDENRNYVIDANYPKEGEYVKR